VESAEASLRGPLERAVGEIVAASQLDVAGDALLRLVRRQLAQVPALGGGSDRGTLLQLDVPPLLDLGRIPDLRSRDTRRERAGRDGERQHAAPVAFHGLKLFIASSRASAIPRS